MHVLRATDQIYDLLIEEDCKVGDHAILYGNAGAVKVLLECGACGSDYISNEVDTTTSKAETASIVMMALKSYRDALDTNDESKIVELKAFLRSIEDEKNDLEKVGAEIVKRALSYPLKLIAKGAGVNGSVVSEKVFSSDNSKYEYNAAKGNYEDLMAVGIIDPTKVVRCCEGHAASVAKTFFISDLSYKGFHNILNFA
nr:ruBisCO large subunit-binding protein subunit beta, chloroplastic [Ipomoea batatas]GMD05990.1 ruBisCO large subunit-binding protein subunit beta, chloroplastic [Ipomoea batatas]